MEWVDELQEEQQKKIHKQNEKKQNIDWGLGIGNRELGIGD